VSSEIDTRQKTFSSSKVVLDRAASYNSENRLRNSTFRDAVINLVGRQLVEIVLWICCCLQKFILFNQNAVQMDSGEVRRCNTLNI
jgi:hypothetical protein